MSFYPPHITERFTEPRHAGRAEGANGVGTAATFVCGSFVRFSIRVERESKRIESAKFQSNGCGYMVATAEVIAAEITGRELGELHGLDDQSLKTLIDERLESFEPGRTHCRDACFEAVHGAFADYRSFQLEEFQGEKALICTCFAVTEERIEAVIGELADPSVEAVGDLCNAGTGCGSCRMLIQEMIDGR